MSPEALLVTLLRFFHPNGRSKDWAVAWNDRGVQIFYGATDTALRTLTIPATQCRGSPQVEAESRLRKKLAEGYRQQGLFCLDMKGRRTLQPQSSGPGLEGTATAGGDAPPAVIPIYWQRYADDSPEWWDWNGEGSLKLRAKALEVLQALHRAGLIRDYQIKAHESDAQLWRCDVQSVQGWAFGYQGGGLDSAGAGQGVLQYTSDAPAALLFILAVAKADQSITVVDDHSQVLTRIPPGVAVEDNVLKDLDLKEITLQERLAEATVGQDAGKWYF